MKRSKFSLSHYKLFSSDMGDIVPIGLMEVLPGDTFQQATSLLLRVSPLLSPVMHPVHARIHHWFVPHRIIWDDWESFITGGPDGMDASVFPTITMPGGGGATVGSLADYLGVPTGVNSLEVSALPFRAYALIWNEWYRDQDLQTSLTIDKTSGPDTTTNTTLQRCCWEKDYFTSSRPWTQKGPEVTVPLGSSAPIVGTGDPTQVYSAADTAQKGPLYWSNTQAVTVNPNLDTAGNLLFSSNPAEIGLETDLSNADGVSINTLREAFALQRYEEARARYGSRYTEYLRYLGVRSSDARLQRPEYLGGGKQTIQFSEVLQTGTNFDANTGVANLRGHGIGALRSNRYRRFFEEHGYIISVMSVRPKTMYVQGLPRTWNRRTKEDFWQRELQHIGQQEVLYKELYAAHSTPDDTFGYQDRYDEYRRMESSVGGTFRTTLNYWHMARIFASDPALNATFVDCEPTKRTNADQTSDVLWVMAYHNVQARRQIARTGTSSSF